MTMTIAFFRENKTSVIWQRRHKGLKLLDMTANLQEVGLES